MATTIDLNSKTPIQVTTAVHTSVYATPAFQLKENEFRYFEISTTEDWELSIDIGVFTTQSGYSSNDKLTGYSIFINWKGGANRITLDSFKDGSYTIDTRISTPSTLNSNSRLGVAVSPEMLKFYLNNTYFGTYRFDTDSIVSGISLANKNLNVAVTGWNHVDGGVTSCYFDPKLWTSNSDKYPVALNGQVANISTPLKNLKQY